MSRLKGRLFKYIFEWAQDAKDKYGRDTSKRNASKL